VIDDVHGLITLALAERVGPTRMSGDEVVALVARGALTVAIHDGLALLNYVSAALDGEVGCLVAKFRGLVVTTEGETVCPSSAPFIDLSPTDPRVLRGHVHVTEKADGVLVSVFRHGGRVLCATRTAFSHPAITAARIAVDAVGAALPGGHCAFLEVRDPLVRTVIPSAVNDVRLVDVRRGDMSVGVDALVEISLASGVMLPTIVFKGPAHHLKMSPLWHRLEGDASLEGFVIRDNSNCRYRVVSPVYAARYDLATIPTVSMMAELYRDGWDIGFLMRGLPSSPTLDELVAQLHAIESMIADQTGRPSRELIANIVATLGQTSAPFDALIDS
jgi:hypothetical protein